MTSINLLLHVSFVKIVQVMIYDKKCKYFFKKILKVVRLEPTISTLTAIRSIQLAKRDSDRYSIRKYFTLKSILFIMFANLKLVLRSYTSLYGIFMSASLTLYIYTIVPTKSDSHVIFCLQLLSI